MKEVHLVYITLGDYDWQDTEMKIVYNLEEARSYLTPEFEKEQLKIGGVSECHVEVEENASLQLLQERLTVDQFCEVFPEVKELLDIHFYGIPGVRDKLLESIKIKNVDLKMKDKFLFKPIPDREAKRYAAITPLTVEDAAIMDQQQRKKMYEIFDASDIQEISSIQWTDEDYVRVSSKKTDAEQADELFKIRNEKIAALKKENKK